MANQTPAEIAKKAADAKAVKRAAFLKVAPGRVSRTIKSISLLGNLGGASYDFEPQHAQEIVATLRRAVDTVETKLTQRGKAAESSFRFTA